MRYTIYRETAATGRKDWGSRPTEGVAVKYAEALVKFYTQGPVSLGVVNDSLLGVQAIEDRTGEVVFGWHPPRQKENE